MAQSQTTLRISEAQLRSHYFGNRALVILAVCTALGGVFLVFGCLFFKAEQRGNKNSVLATGRITDKGRRSDTNRTADGDIQWTYWIIYRYRDEEGRSYENRETLDFADWEKVQKGDSMAIEYPHGDPKASRKMLNYAPSNRNMPVFCLIVGTLLSAGSSLIAVTRWLTSYRRARRLRDGIAVPGEVLERVRRNFPQVADFVQYRLAYRFADADGTERTGKTPWLARDVACQFAAGDPIVVVQDPKQPSHHEADVFQVRSDEMAAT
ncbi:MAG TPA: DUF3592 domain-containing protein [Gemmataceae bacterium]|jgi:hypothetical protein|nr:DUF3592 domain-containing protein [Gemmataceae bacterium]